MIALGGFDILGHADLPRKTNGNGRWFDPEREAYRLRTAEIASAARAAGLVVEVNTGGLNRGYLRSPYPSPPFLRLFREQRVPAIVTADAHCAADLDGHYGEALLALTDAGYACHALFEGTHRGFVPHPL